jgi:type IX secretion system PorP/SprF family membrane protein
MKRRLLLAAGFAIAFGTVRAQDVHYTQAFLLPDITNPAQTGNFEGTFRLGGLYRSQWSQGIKNGYATPLAFGDFNLNGFRKTDWIGVGVNFYQDKAGIGALTQSLAGLSGAYHMGLNKKMTSVFSVGVSVGYGQRRVDESRLRFEGGLLTGTNAGEFTNINNDALNYTDLALGVDYATKIGKSDRFNIGLNVAHLLKPKFNLLTPTVFNFSRTLIFHTEYERALSKRLSVTPSLLIRSANAGSFTGNILGIAGYKLDPKRNIAARAGVGYRFGDALMLIGGIDFGKLRVSGAFDFTTSAVRNDTNIQDGFEVGLTYTEKIYKKPSVKPVILCPRF